MPKFISAVQLIDPSNNLRVGFVPGEEVPGWALSRVGSHVHDGEPSDAPTSPASTDEANAEAGLIIARAEDDAAEIIAKAEVEAEAILAGARKVAEPTEAAEAPVSDDSADDAQSGEPDFTKPAAPKRGRPRKVQD